MTLTDLVSFRPTPPTLISEPDHIGIAGLPQNLIAHTTTQTLHGHLFDLPVTVRFTPHHYTFTPGDGTTETHHTGGTTWASTGNAQFTPTTTSHTYTHRGTYPATVTVSYTPTVTFDNTTWQTVPGYITATSSTQRIRILEAHTALVAHTCTEDPTAPGC